MKKVIINDCFGGYGWSKQGVLEIVKRAFPGNTPRFFVDKTEVDEESFFKDRGLFWYIGLCDNCYDSMSISRTDPIAIEVLEEFGSDFCSDEYSELVIEEFDDEKYDLDIDEYDGSETLELTPVVNINTLMGLSTADDVAEYFESLGVRYRI